MQITACSYMLCAHVMQPKGVMHTCSKVCHTSRSTFDAVSQFGDVQMWLCLLNAVQSVCLLVGLENESGHLESSAG